MKIVYSSPDGAWLHRAAAEVLRRGHQPHLYTSTSNSTALPPDKYTRSWPFHLACKPFYHLFGGRFSEAAFHRFFPVWRTWIEARAFPSCEVVHAVMGFATEPFDHAEKLGALKVLDASNSHPTSFYGFWQRELDIWNAGRQVSLPRRVFARANREIERADVVVCASTYVRDTMLYNGVPEARLAINPFGADLATFVPRQALPPTPRFLFAGLLTLRKGLQYLIPGFEKLKQQVPAAELILCGPRYPDFEKLFRRWSHLFTYIPSLPHARLSELMRTCTAFVFPSVEEGFARVIAEAMAAGLPVIATHNSGASTVVNDGVEGLIIPTRSPDAVCEAMLKLIEHPERCVAMGKTSAARMAVSGSWGAYAERLLDIYSSHLSLRSAKRQQG